MRNSLRAGLLAAAGIVAGAGCGDGPICPSEVVVVIQSPAAGSTITSADDQRSDTPGIQVDVSARSTLHDTAFTLTVTDAAGAVATFDARSDDDGDVTFSGVTLPAGAITLTVTGTSGQCGTGSDQVEVDEIELTVVTDGECMLSIDEGPIESDFYAPLPVLNASNDSDPDLPNFQAHSTVQTVPGFEVELFVLDVGAGSEASLGTMVADDSGEVTFEYTLAQGIQAVRATCIRSSVNEASATHTVVVDTVAPTCSLDVPAEGATITSADDEDPGTGGIQFTWSATVDAGDSDDVEGEATTFYRNAQAFEGTPVAANGSATTVEPAEFTAPGTIPVAFRTQDHALNRCEDAHEVEVQMPGCSVVIQAPVSLVTEDSDADDTNGFQTDVVALIGSECAGQTATADCGLGAVDVEVPGDGTTTFADVTLDEDPAGAGSTTCTVTVSSPSGDETSDSATVTYNGSDLLLTATVIDRQAIELTWEEFVGTSAYEVRYSTTPFTDFESEGTVVPGVGTALSVVVEELRPGQMYYVGVAALDDGGDMVALATTGPVIPTLAATGAIAPPALDAAADDFEAFGFRLAAGDYDADGFADVAVAAPYLGADEGAVYVYFGSADGIGDQPDVTIAGAVAGGFFGSALARVQWDGAGGDDLAIGEPGANAGDGAVFVFTGATLAGASAPLSVADADASITVDTTAANWFTGGLVGWSLAAGQIDADETGEDLAIGVPGGGGFVGGLAIVYGGSGATDIVLSDDDANASLGGAGVHWFVNPVAATTGFLFADSLEYLGDMRAGDGVGDIGVTQYNDSDEDAPTPEPDRVFVLRGRAAAPVDALEEITLGASDLVIELDTADTTTTFGEAMGSIADQNGDGFRDFVVTAFRLDGGRVWIIDGAATSTLAAPHVITPDSAGYLTQFTSPPTYNQRFGTDVANNAESPLAADVNGDGVEDLVLVGGREIANNPTAGLRLTAWFGGEIPTGDVLAETAPLIIEAPAGFENAFAKGQPGALSVTWLGDVNADGLADICWSDYEAGGPDPGFSPEGRIEVLWDDGQ